MRTLVVQKRLLFPPRTLDRQAEAFLTEVRRVIGEARERHGSAPLELADIGFVPAGEHIELRLYFREPVKNKTESLLLK